VRTSFFCVFCLFYPRHAFSNKMLAHHWICNILVKRGRIQMNTRIIIKSIKISSYIRLCVWAALSVGILYGLISFLFSMISGSPGGAEVQIVSMTITGVPAKLLVLLAVPLIYAFCGLIFSLISYYPFMFILKRWNKFTIEGEFEIKQ